MNVFGAITILVGVFGAFLGGGICALLVGRLSPVIAWPAMILAAVASGYCLLKAYFWSLERLDEMAKARKGRDGGANHKR
jgi:hypothetical protein